MGDSHNSTDTNAVELERQGFSKANTKEEYLGYVARLILNLRQQQDNLWKKEAFRKILVRKLEEVIRDSGNSTDRNAVELERQGFSRANTKEENLGYVVRLILHVRQQQDNQRQTEAFRKILVRKLEEAIRDSGNSTDRIAVELERQVFGMANTKEEYLGYVARLILHVRHPSSIDQINRSD